MKKLIILFIFLSTPLVFAKNYTPAECPVVGNTQSYIFHIPGGKFYKRMLVKNKHVDNRKCFKTQQEAKTAGYRKSKR